MIRNEIISLIEKYKLEPKLQLGQHFLADDEIIFNIIELFDKKDEVFCVGLGLGTLISKIAVRVKKIIVCEIDRELVKIFEKEYGPCLGNVEIILGDAFKIAWPNLPVFFSSLPYHAAEGLIKKAITHSSFKKIILIMPFSLFKRSKEIFDVEFELIREIDGKKFYPESSSKSCLVRLVR